MFLDPFGLPLGLASVWGGVLNSSGELGESYAWAEVPCFGVETLAGGVVLALCCERLSSDTGLNPESFVFVLLNTVTEWGFVCNQVWVWVFGFLHRMSKIMLNRRFRPQIIPIVTAEVSLLVLGEVQSVLWISSNDVEFFFLREVLPMLPLTLSECNWLMQFERNCC